MPSRSQSRAIRFKARCAAFSAVIVLLLLNAVPTECRGQELSVAEQNAQLEFFEARIRPVLVTHCYECHSASAKTVRGGLLLDSVEGTRAGGDSGPAVVPGQPDESLLLSALRYESFEMPPDQRLAPEIVADFTRWIQNGAFDPRTGGTVLRSEGIDLEAGREFWCFRPVQRPDIPPAGEHWARSDIDRFVAAGQESHGVAPAPDVDSEQLLRRLYLVLIGLPPGIDAQADFAAAYLHDPEAAVASVVDELLASPQFGVRWGRHWLDVTRFAESSGGGRSLMFPAAWRFRDYVIQAFNEDRPFNQLIREHIAGDLLPADSDTLHDQYVTGVGYLVLGPTNYEEQDKEQLRMNVVDEQIDTIGRTFLAMTLGCARCHDHKFDPIPTADYYGLAGIFRSTRTLTPGNVSGYVTTELRTGADRSVMDQWTVEEQNLERQLRDLNAMLGSMPSGTGAQRNAADFPGVVVDDGEASFEGEWTTSQFQQPYVGSGYQHSGKMKTGRTARFEAALPAGTWTVRMSWNRADSRSSDVPVRIRHADGETVIHVDQRQPVDIDGTFAELGRFRFEAQTPAVVIVDAENSAAGYVIVDAIQFVNESDLSSASAADPRIPAAPENLRTLQQDLKRLEAQLKQHRAAKPEAPVAMGVSDEDEPADWHLHVRGEIRNLGPVVPRGALTVVASAGTDRDGHSGLRIPPGESGRRQLAEWLADPNHPLTSRVFVNRIWLHVFGEGLVRTPDNFGSTGTLPTHPELLDYLATTFVQEDGWSTKSLIRRLCLSRAFRMSSEHQADVIRDDPDNLWMSRAFRRPLDAETLRDAMLLIGGNLDRDFRGGRTIGKLATYDNSYDHEQWSVNARSIYVPWFRNSMLDLFSAFNVANPNLVSGRRNRSVLPAQALYLLNSPFVMKQAELAAEKLLAEQSADQADSIVAIENVWRSALSRSPTADEVSDTRAFLASLPDDPQAAWTGVFHALFSSIDFRYLD